MKKVPGTFKKKEQAAQYTVLCIPVSTRKNSAAHFLTFSTRLHDFFCCEIQAKVEAKAAREVKQEKQNRKRKAEKKKVIVARKVAVNEKRIANKKLAQRERIAKAEGTGVCVSTICVVNVSPYITVVI